MRVILCLFLCPFFLGCADGFRMAHIATSRLTQSKIKIQSAGSQSHEGLKVQMKGKTVFVAGVADSTGYGWAIAKSCAEAGARVLLGTWPPMMPLFEPALNAGKFDDDLTLPDGSKMEIAKIYPLDATFDIKESIPAEILTHKRYKAFSGYSIQEVVDKIKEDYGKIDYLVHSLANGPEVTKPLIETSRDGYLKAISASAYSLVSMVSRFAPIMNEGGSVISLSYIASERVIPGYGGGMSSAKAALESDTRTLAYEVGRKYGIRVNTISAGPLASRAAKAIGGAGQPKTFIDYAIDYSKANAPLTHDLYNTDVGNAGAFLLSPLSRAITGITLYVDNGLFAMGRALDSRSMEGST